MPTFNQAGAPNFPGVTGWIAMYGPAGLPAPVAARLAAEIRKIVQSEDFVQRIAHMGNETAYMAPAEMKQWLADDFAMWKQMIGELGLTPEKK